jgi:hypothetical protein
VEFEKDSEEDLVGVIGVVAEAVLVKKKIK